MVKKTIKKDNFEYTIFEEDSAFDGILSFKKPLYIKGNYIGQIQGDSILKVDPQASIEASIEVDSLILYGTIKGNIIAKNKVELKQGAQLIGNIKAPIVEIEEGVIFDGQCEMQKHTNQEKTA